MSTGKLPSVVFAGCFVVAALVLVPSAAAQDAAAEDQAKVQQCLDAVGKAGSDPRACIGVVADPCLERPEETSNDETIACMTRETRIWQQLLATRYGELEQVLEDEAGNDLDAVQDAWNTYREKRCALGVLIYPEEALADVWAADCTLEETGRRAIELGAFYDELNGR